MKKEVVKDVAQEVKVPQVKALHPFNGKGLKMAKGEVGWWIGYKSKRKKMVWGGSERSPTPFLQKNISVLLKIIFFLVLQGLFLDSQD